MPILIGLTKFEPLYYDRVRSTGTSMMDFKNDLSPLLVIMLALCYGLSHTFGYIPDLVSSFEYPPTSFEGRTIDIKSPMSSNAVGPRTG